MIVAGEPFPSLRFWAELRFVRRVSMQCRFRLFIDSLYLLTFLSCLSL